VRGIRAVDVTAAVFLKMTPIRSKLDFVSKLGEPLSYGQSDCSGSKARWFEEMTGSRRSVRLGREIAFP